MKNMDSIVLGSSKIGVRGQVTIPKKAREKFDLKIGELVLFAEEDGKLVVKKGVLKI